MRNNLTLLVCAVGFVTVAAGALPQAQAGPVGPSAQMAARLKKYPAPNWMAHYLPDDRYKIAGGVWKYVSTDLDTYYHKPSSGLMLRQSADHVIGFPSAEAAEEGGYKPEPGLAPFVDIAVDGAGGGGISGALSSAEITYLKSFNTLMKELSKSTFIRNKTGISRGVSSDMMPGINAIKKFVQVPVPPRFAGAGNLIGPNLSALADIVATNQSKLVPSADVQRKALTAIFSFAAGIGLLEKTVGPSTFYKYVDKSSTVSRLRR